MPLPKIDWSPVEPVPVEVVETMSVGVIWAIVGCSILGYFMLGCFLTGVKNRRQVLNHRREMSYDEEYTRAVFWPFCLAHDLGWWIYSKVIG